MKRARHCASCHAVSKIAALLSISALAAPSAANAGDAIWWSFGGGFHQGIVRDESAAPKGKLLSDNLHWYGPTIYTGCTYEYDCKLSVKDEYVPKLNRFLRDKDAPPQKPVFARKLTDGQATHRSSVAGVVGGPIKATFDFKRPCEFTEVDFMGDTERGRTQPYKGNVSFSADGRSWSEPVAFEGTQSVMRVRLSTPAKGRYMRFEFAAVEKKTRQYLGEVVVWGDGEVSEKYPEDFEACVAPFVAPQSLRGMPETAMDERTFADWQKRVGADVVVVPTRLYSPQKYVPITNAPPKAFRISMTRSERETRYFAVANASDTRRMVKIEKPDFGPGVEAEIWLGAIIHAQHPTRELTEGEKHALLMLDLDPPSDIGPLNRMAVLPFVRGDMKPQPNFIRRFCGNAEQMLGFPGAFPLEKGEAAVFMLRLTTKNAAPGVRTARLSGGRGRALRLELSIVDAELDDGELIVISYGPFIGQFPYETDARRRLDVQFMNDLGVNLMTCGPSFPKEGSKQRLWYDSAPDKILRRQLLGGNNERSYFPVSKGRQDGRVTDEDLKAIIEHVDRIKEDAARLGIPGDRYVLDFPDEPGPRTVANLLKVARAVKARHPDVMLFANPCFFTDAVRTNETLMADLRSTYVKCIDFSVPSFLAARRDWARNEFFTSAHRANMMYAHPARRMGRHGAWDAAVWGFNGFGYYTYWEPASRCYTWDFRTNGESILGSTYRMAYPSGDGFAIAPIYETMREAVEDFHLVKTLQKRGHGALVDELYKISSTQRNAADFDELRERLMAALAGR